MVQFLIIAAIVAQFVAPYLGVTLPQQVVTTAGLILVIGIALLANAGVSKARKPGGVRDVVKGAVLIARDVKEGAAEVKAAWNDNKPNDTSTKHKA